MAVLILSWIAVAFVHALLAHALIPDHRDIDSDVTLVAGTVCALTGAMALNYVVEQPLWGINYAGFAGCVMGAVAGVSIAALACRAESRRDEPRSGSMAVAPTMHLTGARGAVIGPRANTEDAQMLYWSVVFFVLALIAAVFGFGGIAAGAATIGKILFAAFLALAVVSLIAGRRPTRAL